MGEGRRWVKEREVSRARNEKDFGQNNDIGGMRSSSFPIQREISLRNALDNIEFSATSSGSERPETKILIPFTRFLYRYP